MATHGDKSILVCCVVWFCIGYFAHVVLSEGDVVNGGDAYSSCDTRYLDRLDKYGGMYDEKKRADHRSQCATMETE